MADSYSGPERRATDDRIHDHETRLVLLEAICEQLTDRMDRTDSLLHGIEIMVNSLNDEMKSHVQLMKHHIDHSFAVHERNEMSMHKEMLVRAMQVMIGGVASLVTAIGVMGWWIFQHLFAQ